MARPYINLIGKKFGKLTVIDGPIIGASQYKWACKCDCGNPDILNIFGCALRKGDTQSCGCLQKENVARISTIHGMYKTRTYRIWRCMINRCEYKNDISYKNYGAKGIKICEMWHNFENFIQDMGICPSNLTLDRIDNNNDYHKENCRWSTWKIQNRNKENIRLIEFNGKKQCITAWEEELGFKKTLITNRLANGWSIEKALTIPVNSKGNWISNQPNAIYLTLNDKTKSMSKWSKVTGLSVKTIKRRKLNGWNDEKILLTPPKNKNKKYVND